MTRPDADTLRRLYVQEGLTTVEIGQRYGCSHKTVARWLEASGIPRRRTGPRRGIRLASRLPCPSATVLYHLYVEQNRSSTEVGQVFGVGYATALGWLREAGIPLKPARRRMTIGERRTGKRVPLPDAKTFRALYESGMTLKGIGERYGVSTTVTTRLANQYGVVRRLTGYSRNAGRRIAASDGHLVRSSYELRVCEWLTEHHVEHVYEPPINGTRRADFLANGWYIEVWGLRTSEYGERKASKQEWYRDNGVPLIELSDHTFNPCREGLWKRRLVKVLSRPSPE